MSYITIDKTEKTPVYLQIFSQIRAMIFAGVMADGYTLPSERKLSEELGVHRNTVTKAYAELKAEDLIESHQGKSYRVSFRKNAKADSVRKDVYWDALLRTEFEGFASDFDELYSRSFEKDLISFAGGVAARDIYPPEEIAEAFETILRRSMEKAYFYTSYQGDGELRKEITSFMATKGIKANPSNVQIFAENNQALDFILNLMLSPGDGVIIDETMSADVYRTIQLAGGRVINVPADENGMICDNLDIIIEKTKPKFIYVDSSFNNPKGTYMTIERKQQILDLSYRYRIPIIEEDEGSELYYEVDRIPSIKSMDRGENVIYMYSFSLTMVPGIGVSFVIADNRIIEKLSEMVSLKVANADWAAQMLMLEYMKNGLFNERLDLFRREYRRKRDLMCERLDALVTRYGIEYRKPEGGVYLWVKLPSRINARDLLAETQKRGMTFMPGYLFFSSKSMGRNYLRFNYSYPTDEGIEKGMDIFEEAIEQLLS
ncbi:MAG: PLP-dependent aminotransferase family protein [Bacillota bacterium]|nr:PLP-dependent aminotransferase family protein [Bacillota bacterium]